MRARRTIPSLHVLRTGNLSISRIEALSYQTQTAWASMQAGQLVMHAMPSAVVSLAG